MTEMETTEIQKYTDSVLHEMVLGLVHRERGLSMSIVQHLKEIDRRRLWSEMAYSSLFEYCTKALAYSESQAYRRLSALKLIGEIPDLEQKIVNGSLNLTTVAQAQSFFRHEAKTSQRKVTTEEKRELLNRIDGKTQKEVASELAALSPSFAHPDQLKPISAEEIQIQFAASRALAEKITRIKEILVHAIGADAGYGQLFEHICDLTLQRLDPDLRAGNKSSKAPPKTPPNVQVEHVDLQRGAYSKRESGTPSTIHMATQISRRRAIRHSLRRHQIHVPHLRGLRSRHKSNTPCADVMKASVNTPTQSLSANVAVASGWKSITFVPLL